MAVPDGGTINAMFSTYMKHLGAGHYREAMNRFLDAYHTYPKEKGFFYGVIVAALLACGVSECIRFLEKEKDLSPFREIMLKMLAFLKANPVFESLPAPAALYDIGLFLKNRGFYTDAGLFFSTIRDLKPDDRKTMTALGELAFFEGDYDRGLRCYCRAAKLSR
ncbi:MAG: hypothetical protein JW881_16705 [Spirochaetales bacterium]|nr:hypothetical protein [Spirochaetales bacterium]